jgi:hypothetical protein
MADGVGGVLVGTVEECATAIVALLHDRDRARELARKGQERVNWGSNLRAVNSSSRRRR